jgi:hypothetical protein
LKENCLYVCFTTLAHFYGLEKKLGLRVFVQTFWKIEVEKIKKGINKSTPPQGQRETLARMRERERERERKSWKLEFEI